MTDEKVLAALGEALHREDTTGRAIHEDHFAMQVPSYGADVCTACPHEAAKLLAALHDAGWTLVRQEGLDAAWAEAEAALPEGYAIKSWQADGASHAEALRALARVLRGDDR